MLTQTHQAALDRVRQDFTGGIIVPDDPAYDEVWLKASWSARGTVYQ